MIEPGPLHTISSAGDPVSVCQHNFEAINRELYKFTPTYQSGVATVLIGPPTSGARVLDERWVDAWGAHWRCTVAGTPGTWRQETPAVRAGEPSSGTIPTGYVILDADEGYRKKIHRGSYVWDRVEGLAMLNVLDFGADRTGATFSDAAFHAALAACPTNAQVYAPAGTYKLAALTWDQNVGLRGDGESTVLKHGDAATGHLLTMTVANSSIFERFKVDGNKAGQTLTGAAHTRYACLVTYSDAARLRDILVTGHCLAGILDLNTRTAIYVDNVHFVDGAEHGGTYRSTGRGTEQSCAIQVSATTASINPHWYVTHCRVYQSAAASATGKAPGGFIFGGDLSTSTVVTPVVTECYFRYVGQSYPRTGDANHIGCVDFYEGTARGSITRCEFTDNQYGAVKCQNGFGHSITHNYANGMASGIAESEGVALVLVDINRVLGTASTDYGFTVVAHNRLFDGGNCADIRIAGRAASTTNDQSSSSSSSQTVTSSSSSESDNSSSSSTAQSVSSSSSSSSDADDFIHDILLDNNICINVTGRALQIINATGKITSSGGIYKGAAPTASGGAVEVQNLDASGEVYFDSPQITSTAHQGLYAFSGISGSIYIDGGKIENAGTGTTCVVLSAAGTLSIQNVELDGSGGGAYNINGAGKLVFGNVTVVAGSRTLNYANCGMCEGQLVGTGSPETVVKSSPGLATYHNLSGGASTTLYTKQSGTATNTGWAGIG